MKLSLARDSIPLRVVDVLLAAFFISAGSLKMAIGTGTNPDLFAGGRDTQRINPD